MPIYEPQTSYASKIDEDRRFATAEEAAKHDRERAVALCADANIVAFRDTLEDPDIFSNSEFLRDLRRSILYLADLIREGEEKKAKMIADHQHLMTSVICRSAPIEEPRPEPTQEDFFKAYEEALRSAGFTNPHKTTNAVRYDVQNNLSWPVSDHFRTAWRAIGLDGEPTAERIRALREK